jgi:pimeloyl-ACP methyl ester carboxylesterase
VNGIRLHYLDWGGEGETLIFLTAMGCSAHLFDKFAPRFAGKFRVLALTRRGQGESDYPESGYDVDTLTDDILIFLNALNIDKVILAGHSMAGMELSHFAVTYPEKVTKLIYLDAAYDRRDLSAIRASDPLKDIQPPNMKKEYSSIEEYIAFVKSVRPDLEKIWDEMWDEVVCYDLTKVSNDKYVEKDTSAIGKAMFDTIDTYAPEDSQIKIPILSFFCLFGEPDLPNYLTDEQKSLGIEFLKQTYQPWQTRAISKFRDDVPQANIIVIPKGHHYCFIAHENLVYEAMSKFLQVTNA